MASLLRGYRYFFLRAARFFHREGDHERESRYRAISLLTVLGILNLVSLLLIVGLLGGPSLLLRIDRPGIAALITAAALSLIHWAALGRRDRYRCIVSEFSSAPSRVLDKIFALYITASIAVFLICVVYGGFFR